MRSDKYLKRSCLILFGFPFFCFAVLFYMVLFLQGILQARKQQIIMPISYFLFFQIDSICVVLIFLVSVSFTTLSIEQYPLFHVIFPLQVESVALYFYYSQMSRVLHRFKSRVIKTSFQCCTPQLWMEMSFMHFDNITFLHKGLRIDRISHRDFCGPDLKLSQVSYPVGQIILFSCFYYEYAGESSHYNLLHEYVESYQKCFSSTLAK